jgi:hypothetical protein
MIALVSKHHELLESSVVPCRRGVYRRVQEVSNSIALEERSYVEGCIDTANESAAGCRDH